MRSLSAGLLIALLTIALMHYVIITVCRGRPLFSKAGRHAVAPILGLAMVGLFILGFVAVHHFSDGIDNALYVNSYAGVLFLGCCWILFKTHRLRMESISNLKKQGKNFEQN